jgi:hypothetical protein
MVVWLVIAPIVLLLLTLAGANWKVFHLAYCRNMLSSDDAARRERAVCMIVRTHVEKGMHLDAVRALLRPATLESPPTLDAVPPNVMYQARTGRDGLLRCTLFFDKKAKRFVFASIQDPAEILGMGGVQVEE